MFERDRAPRLWGFPHHQSPLAGWYPTQCVGYFYSASSPGGLGRCIIARVAHAGHMNGALVLEGLGRLST